MTASKSISHDTSSPSSRTECRVLQNIRLFLKSSSKTGRLRRATLFLRLGIVGLLTLFLLFPLSAQDTEIRYLTGTGFDQTVPWDFYVTSGRQSGYWTTLPVPSHWELHGFGEYNYGHDEEKADEVGRYRRDFEVPAHWKGRIVELVFEGVMTDAVIRLNGSQVGGRHRGGFYEFRRNVTQLLIFGSSNRLEVDVYKMSDNDSVNRAEREADYWVFGGIYRPVRLEAHPSEFIRHVAISAEANGRIRVEGELANVQQAASIRAQIFDEEGRPLEAALEVAVERSHDTFSVTGQADSPKAWSAEWPHLYQLQLELVSDGEVLHRVRHRFGFRTVEVRRGEGIYLNGRKILLKGVNRHEFWPDSGRATSRELSRSDVLAIKRMNMNAVRMSHYPPARHFLEACDELGLYVLDELAGWQEPPYDTEVGRKLVREMVRRDLNHPSILFWDNGNEGGWNEALDDEFPKHDLQNRTVLHPWELHGGVQTKHYPDYETLESLAAEEVLMPTEMLHGLYDGGSGAGLGDFWRVIRDYSAGGGAFLWALVDEGVVRTDQQGRIDVDGNHAPDGILGPYREREGSFYTIRKIWSPIQIELSERRNEGVDLTFRNLYDFTDLGDCLLHWKLLRLGTLEDPPGSLERLEGGYFTPPALAPGQKGLVPLPVPAGWQNHDLLELEVFDPRGASIHLWSLPLQPPRVLRSRLVTPISAAALLEQLDSAWLVRSGDMEYEFDPRTARLQGVRRSGRPFSLTNGPRPATGEEPAVEVEGSPDRVGYIIEAAAKDRSVEFRWTFLEEGWLRLEYEYEPGEPAPNLGLSFDYPEGLVQEVEWLGQGPQRVWKNRLEGTHLGRWSRPYKNNLPGQTWDYPHFKGYYSGLYQLRLKTREGNILVATDHEDLFWRLFTPRSAGDDLDRHTEVEFPPGDLSFLHAVAPIGTKFHPPENLGPSGQPNEILGRLSMTLYFRFE